MCKHCEDENVTDTIPVGFRAELCQQVIGWTTLICKTCNQGFMGVHHGLSRDDLAKCRKHHAECTEAAEQARVRTIEPMPLSDWRDPSDPCKPAPVIERFVIWDYTTYLLGGTELFTRHRRGDVVATIFKDRCMVGFYRDNKMLDLVTIDPEDYQTLKANGCFGDQV